MRDQNISRLGRRLVTPDALFFVLQFLFQPVISMKHQPKYDAAQREKIRRDLLAYKLAFGIGAPRLANLIAEAHPNKPWVDHRRVARFLAEETDPDEAFVDWCATFLKTVPEIQDRIWHLAQGLLSFYGQHEGWDYTGAYALLLDSAAKGDAVSGRVTITSDDKFWRVVVRGNDHQIMDGVLINLASCGLMLTVDRLTGAAQSCSMAGGPARIAGQCFRHGLDWDTLPTSFRLEARP